MVHYFPPLYIEVAPYNVSQSNVWGTGFRLKALKQIEKDVLIG